MAAADESVCSRAMAYLKVKEFGPSENEVSLSHADSPIITNLNNSLCVTYVVDESDHLKYLQNRDCDKSGLSESELHKIAIENLAELARARIQVIPYGNIYAVMLDGNFEASLILVDSLWEKGLAHLAPNGFVAAIPARDILAFCDADSAEGIAELLQLIERIKNGDHMLSREVYKRGESGWRPLNQH